MSRSPLMRALRRAAHVARLADREGLTTAEALARKEAFLASRRRFLQGASAVAAAATLPRAARAAARGSVDVGIVGAGLAGLSCADALRGYGIDATIYEASSRAGGRCWSMGLGFPGPVDFPGQVVERGGELIDTLHTNMRAYANAFGFALEDLTDAEGDTLYYVDGQVYDEYAVVEEYRALVDAMRADLRRIGAPTADAYTEDDAYFDNLTLAEYLDSRGAGNLIRNVVDVAYTGEFGLDITQQSSLSFLLFIHADRRSKFRPWGVYSDERYHVVGGNQQIPNALAEELADRISYGHSLVRVARTSGGRYELTFDTDGGTVTRTHDVIVSAIPFSVLRNVDIDASVDLPGWKRQAIDELVYGTNAKTMIGFDARPWIEAGCTGSVMAVHPDVQNVWETNAANATATRAVLTDYAGGALGAALSQNAVQQNAAAFLAGLENVIPGVTAAATRLSNGKLRVHLEHWPSNPLVLGAYVNNHPGYFTTIADREATPVDGFFFAGEHASSFYEWQGFMEGAVCSGFTAADDIRRATR